MPDSRSHRGPDPRDLVAFSPEARPILATAVFELSWLLGRGYTSTASLKLVGDHWSLVDRQRMAVLRSACPDGPLRRRLCGRIEPEDVAGCPLAIDGFNLLTTIEAALGGAVVLIGRDGALRDLAGVHGTYRRVEETLPAVLRTAETLEELGVSRCQWFLDRPVSNSGRLRAILMEVAADRGLDWRVELVDNPDAILATTTEIVVSADSQILDRTGQWLNLARTIVATSVPSAWVIDLGAPFPG